MSWTRRVSPTTDGYGPGVAFGNGVFVATTYTGRIARSVDQGVTWEEAASFSGRNFNCLGYGGGVWLAGTFENPAVIYRSTDDGATWTLVSDPSIPAHLVSLAYDGVGTWVALGSGAGPNNYAISTDSGQSWAQPGLFTNNSWYAAAGWDGSQFVADGAHVGGGDVGVAVSADGQNWTETVVTGNYVYVAFDGTRYAVGDTQNSVKSATTVAGLPAANVVSTGLSASDGTGIIGAANGVMLAADYVGGLATSSDHGETWSLQTSGFDAGNNINGIAYGNNTFVVVGDGGNIATYDQQTAPRKSIREQIIEAALAKLNTATPVGVPQTSRSRQEPYSQDELPAITIKPLREEVEYEAEGKRSYFRKRVLTLRASVHFVGDDSVADPMTVWISTQLDGQTFPTLMEDCIEALYEWEYAAEDQPYIVLHQDFRVTYHTLVGDQTRTQ